MLSVNNLTGFGARRRVSAGGITYTEVARLINTANLATFTFSSVPFGDEGAGRKILVGVTGADFANSVTIGGVGATDLGGTKIGGNETCEFFQREFDTGTSGDIVVAYPGARANCGIVVRRVMGAATAITDGQGGNTGNPVSVTLNVPANGIAFGQAQQRSNSAATWTWAGLPDKSFDEALEASSNYWTGAVLEATTAQPTLAVSAASTQAGVRGPVMHAVSFAPA